MTKETYGIWTDVASILVGDPCQILPEKKWREIINQRIVRSLSSDEDYDHQGPFLLPKYGIIVPTVENCDGWCKTDVYRNKDGWPTRIVVNLSSKVEKPGEKK